MTEPVRRESARVAVIDASSCVLLLRKCDPSRPADGEWWELPGGGLRSGETPPESARRELYEVTGIAADELGPRLGVVETDLAFGGTPYRLRETIFSLRIDEEERASATLGEGAPRTAHLGHDWVPLAELRARRLRLRPPQLTRLLASFEA